MAAAKRVLIYGGKGALGAVCVQSFKAKNFWVCSIDLSPNESADANIIVTELNDWEKQDEQVQQRLAEVLQDEKLDGIFCIAGGWAGGNAASKAFIKNSNLMWKQSVWSSCISASLASSHLKQGGVLQLTGAVPALAGTAGMIGYGMAKAAVHQLTKSLAADNGGLPKNAVIATILPVTLDTPMNRKFMPDADQTTWTPLEYVATMFTEWSENINRPASGSLLKLITKDGNTALECVEK
ncbi:dihydropteridine reductase-like isoform X1 [Hydractinia symbiolongicarpus]|uniref:dihydropteridine reductase-like isoform X1 n=1 Tax=Hydractinia symbiolongicarpus TaxID=13093 RepID=UPI00254B46CC|nr:dihydropteridine reductase-like isoform X1 [Hydractinia symbiolongicarpus]